tara:strand:+ start:1264 stop:1470 length:207 start_codon:yes stop_codon:yes gene_type:complete
MEAAAIIAIISVGAASFGTLVTTFFTSMSLSRCKNIACCYECIVCDREVVSDEVVARQVEINGENDNV